VARDCSKTIDALQKCADPSWTLHSFAFPASGICCLPGWTAVQNNGGGVCNPPINDDSSVCSKSNGQGTLFTSSAVVKRTQQSTSQPTSNINPGAPYPFNHPPEQSSSQPTSTNTQAPPSLSPQQLSVQPTFTTNTRAPTSPNPQQSTLQPTFTTKLQTLTSLSSQQSLLQSPFTTNAQTPEPLNPQQSPDQLTVSGTQVQVSAFVPPTQSVILSPAIYSFSTTTFSLNTFSSTAFSSPATASPTTPSGRNFSESDRIAFGIGIRVGVPLVIAGVVTI